MPKIVPIHYRTLIRVFEGDGFVVRRQKGDHIIPSLPNSVWGRNCFGNSVSTAPETEFLRQLRSQSGDWERENS